MLEQFLHRPFLTHQPLLSSEERIVKQVVPCQFTTAILDGRGTKVKNRISNVLVGGSSVAVGIGVKLFEIRFKRKPLVKFVKLRPDLIGELINQIPVPLGHGSVHQTEQVQDADTSVSSVNVSTNEHVWYASAGSYVK